MICVTNEHIERGIPASCSGCPIALAMKEATGEDIAVELGRYPKVYSRTRRLYYPLSAIAVEAAMDFDSTGIMKPFTFEFSFNEGHDNG